MSIDPLGFPLLDARLFRQPDSNLANNSESNKRVNNGDADRELKEQHDTSASHPFSLSGLGLPVSRLLKIGANTNERAMKFPVYFAGEKAADAGAASVPYPRFTARVVTRFQPSASRMP